MLRSKKLLGELMSISSNRSEGRTAREAKIAEYIEALMFEGFADPESSSINRIDRFGDLPLFLPYPDPLEERNRKEWASWYLRSNRDENGH